jgi:hypothetical protein
MANQSYISAWNNYRHRVKLFFSAWLGGFLVSSLVGIALSFLGVPEWAFVIIAAIWGLLFLGAAFHLQFFQCPRCNEPFFKAYWYYNPFATKCVHCALPKGQE